MNRPTRDDGTWSRREALRLFGVGAAMATTACASDPDVSDSATPSSEQRPTALAVPEGAIVRAVLGDLSPESLRHGALLFHEHMSLDPGFWDRLLGPDNEARAGFVGAPDEPYFMQDAETMAAELQTAAQDGVSLLVDGGHADMGRSVAFLQEVSERSGLPIVASGGYYTDPFHPDELDELTEDEIAEMLVQTADTERWGAFGEIASSAEITEGERKVFRAVARAHLATGLPIFTHTANGAAALEQLDIFESLDVSPDRVAIGHMGGLEDPDVIVHRTIASRGASVGFDRLGGGDQDDAYKVPMVRALIDAGYLERVLLASDFARASDTRRNGGPGYAKTVTQFVPMLRAAGATDAEVTTLVTDNPLRFLAFVPDTGSSV